MRHPTDGTLRRLVDEPSGVADADRAHVADCSSCLVGVAAAQQDAARVAAALAPAPGGDVETGWQRLRGALAAEGDDVRRGVPAPLPPRRRRGVLRSPLVAGLGAVTVLAGAGTAAAADWFQVFRTERVAPLALSRADLVGLPDLGELGNVEDVTEVGVRSVPDAAAAERATGLQAPEVDDLPRGVTGQPAFQVVDRASAVFAFDAEEAARATGGDPLPAPPPGLDGSRFRITAGPGLAAVWTQSRGLPALVVARAVAPTAESSGVSFATARDYLLSLPGLPEELAEQLRSFSGTPSTLPLPVPAEFVESAAAEVDGLPATVLASRDGVVSGVVWVDEGVVHAVAGSLDADEVLAVARGLQ